MPNNMMLKFNIDKQHISRLDREAPVEKSRHYLFARFDFVSDEWNDVEKYVTFTNTITGIQKTKLIVDGQVEVPWEVITAGAVEVSCFGGDLVTNDICKFYVGKSGYAIAPDSAEPTPTLIEQMITKLDDSSRKLAALKLLVEVQTDAIASKADTEELNTAISTINSVIETLKTALDTKTSITDFEEFKKLAEETHIALQGLSEDIKTSLEEWIEETYGKDQEKTKIFIETLDTHITTAESNIRNLQNDIVSKVEVAEFESVISTVTSDISKINDSISSLTTTLGTKANSADVEQSLSEINTIISGISESVATIQSDLAKKANITDVNNSVSELLDSIAIIQTDLNGKASSDEVNALSNALATLSSDFNTKFTEIDTALSSKADKKDLDDLAKIVDGKPGIDDIPKAPVQGVSVNGSEVAPDANGIVAFNAIQEHQDISGKENAANKVKSLNPENEYSEEAYPTMGVMFEYTSGKLDGVGTEIHDMNTKLDVINRAIKTIAGGGCSLDSVGLFIADFMDNSACRVTHGAIDKYQRLLVT